MIASRWSACHGYGGRGGSAGSPKRMRWSGRVNRPGTNKVFVPASRSPVLWNDSDFATVVARPPAAISYEIRDLILDNAFHGLSHNRSRDHYGGARH
jgi:hypothetical protein